MSYIITKTDGSQLAIVLDGTTNTDTGLTLIGRNYTGYGQVQNENFVKLLENFADNIPPTQSSGSNNTLTGTLWYDTGNKQLKVYDGTNWTATHRRISATVAPTTTNYSLNVGDQWWDSANYQLYSWTGSTWQLVGPALAAGQSKSGSYLENIQDASSNNYSVLTTYVAGNIVSVASLNNANFVTSNPVVAAELGYSTIMPGINIPTGTRFAGIAENSVRVGGLYANALARVDVSTTFSTDIAVNGNLSLPNANIYVSGSALTLVNKNFGGNVEVYVNTSSFGNVKGFAINGTSGHAYVHSDPIYAMGIATKNYVDGQITQVSTQANQSAANMTAQVAQLRSDTFANIGTTIASTNANLTALQSSVNSTFGTVNTAIGTNVSVINSNISSTNANVTALSNRISALVQQLQNEIDAANAAIQSSGSSSTGYVNTQIQTVLNALQAANVVAATATTNLRSYVDSQHAALASSISGINGTIFTANTQMKGYVDYQIGVVNSTLGDAITKLGGTINTSLSGLNGQINGLSTNGLAPLASPAFSGTPVAPDPGDVSGKTSQIATIDYVTNQIATVTGTGATSTPFNYTVGQGAPNSSTGKNGDFYFQIG